MSNVIHAKFPRYRKHGERLSMLRKRHGLSVAQMAKLVEMSPRTWRRYESGKQQVRAYLLMYLCHEFGVSFDYIWTDVGRRGVKEAIPLSQYQ
jgi:transcriptional regulator with XRE-family HTH domain